MRTTLQVPLDPTLRCDEAIKFENDLRGRIIGQDKAVTHVVGAMEEFHSGLRDLTRPVSNLLFLGPTGVGKTETVRAMADILFGDPEAFVRIDCSEYQESHQISRLIGAPPSYIGHDGGKGGTEPAISQAKLDASHRPHCKLSIVLWDELEKASPALWNLLLGILDNGMMRMGNGSSINFRNTINIMTSNEGARAMSELSVGGMGFKSGYTIEDRLDERVESAAMVAAKKKFSLEFYNRFDDVVVYHTLRPEHIQQILGLELNKVQRRIVSADGSSPYTFSLSSRAREYLTTQGTSVTYGARHLKRAVRKHLTTPLSSMMNSGQLALGDHVLVNYLGDVMRFDKVPADAVCSLPEEDINWAEFHA